MIMMQRFVKVDGKVRTDMGYPAGFMDVVQIDKTNDEFRLLYTTKGRFALHRIKKDEAAFKLCKVKKVFVGDNKTPYAVTHDARTIRYPDPEVRENDTVKVDIASGKATDFVKFEIGNVAMVTGGNSIGRVGVIMHREKHAGNYEIVHLKDKLGRAFATRIQNVFVIGKGEKAWVSLPKGEGVALTVLEESQRRLQSKRTGGGSKKAAKH